MSSLPTYYYEDRKHQMSWLDKYWMFLMPPLSIALLVYKFVLFPTTSKLSSSSRAGGRGGVKKSDDENDDDENRVLLQKFKFWIWLSMPIYSLHQFEEHGYDILGRRYSFVPYANDLASSHLSGDDGSNPLLLSPRVTTIVNLLHVYVIFSYMAIKYEQTWNPIYIGLCYSMMFFNALAGHVVPCLVSQIYNPGCVQSFMMMVPVSIYVLYQYYQYSCTNKFMYQHVVKSMVVCIVFGSFYFHGLALFLPVLLVSNGYLDENFGFTIWCATLLFCFPMLVVPYLPTSSSTIAGNSKNKTTKV